MKLLFANLLLAVSPISAALRKLDGEIPLLGDATRQTATNEGMLFAATDSDYQPHYLVGLLNYNVSGS